MSRDDLEDLRWKKFPVLDDGFVCLVDAMGDDAAVVRAARVSYGRDERSERALEVPRYEALSESELTSLASLETKLSTMGALSDGDAEELGRLQGLLAGEPSRELPAADRHLIRYLMRHRHTTPLEMCEVVLLVRVPMDCWRQWIRHRTASVNEYSTRYSEAIDSWQATKPSEWRLQSASSKQGSAGWLDELCSECEPEPMLDQDTWDQSQVYLVHRDPRDELPDGVAGFLRWWTAQDEWANFAAFDSGETVGQVLTRLEADSNAGARSRYELALRLGVAREQARKNLPLCTYTEAYWKIDLHNLLHFLGLRMHEHAQLEARAYATAIGEQIVAKLFPAVWEAFLDYHPNNIGGAGGMSLSRLDIFALRLVTELSHDGDNRSLTLDEFTRMTRRGDWPAHLAEWAQERCRERDEFVAKARRLGVITQG